MFCRKCGAQIPDDSLFCEKCGARLSGAYTQPQVQPGYGGQPQPAYQQPQPEYMQPGYGQQSQPVYRQPVQQPYDPGPGYDPGYPPQEQYVYDTGAVVREYKNVTAYNGSKAIGVVYGNGTLVVCDDRLEFHKKSGTQAGFGISAVAGLAISALDAKKHPYDVWYYDDVSEIYTAKHAGLISKIVMTLKNGKSLSFTIGGQGTKTNAMIEELCELINSLI